MIGFNVRFDTLAGMQVLLANDYGVTLMAYKPSDDLRCMFGSCAIGIAKIVPEAITDEKGIYEVEDLTLTVMEKMGYTPSEEEKEENLFLDVNISKFFEVVEFCKKLEIQ